MPSPRERQQQYWFRLTAALLDELPAVLRLVIQREHARAAAERGLRAGQPLGRDMTHLVLPHAAFVPDFVFENWRRQPLTKWDFSACLYTLLSTCIGRTEAAGRAAGKQLKDALHELKRQRNSLACHPSRCAIVNNAEYARERAALFSNVRCVLALHGYGHGAPVNLVRRFEDALVRLEQLELKLSDARLADLLARAVALDRNVRRVEARVHAVEERGAEFGGWCDALLTRIGASCTEGVGDSAQTNNDYEDDDGTERDLHRNALTRAYDALSARPYFYRFKRSELRTDLELFSAREAMAKSELYAVRASEAGTHPFSVELASGGRLRDKPLAIEYVPDELAFRCKGVVVADVLELLERHVLRTDAGFVPLDRSQGDGRYDKSNDLLEARVAEEVEQCWQPTAEYLDEMRSESAAALSALENRLDKRAAVHDAAVAATRATLETRLDALEQTNERLRDQLAELQSLARVAGDLPSRATAAALAASDSPLSAASMLVLKQQCVARLFELPQLNRDQRDVCVDLLVLGPTDAVLPLFGIENSDELAAQLVRKLEQLQQFRA